MTNEILLFGEFLGHFLRIPGRLRLCGGSGFPLPAHSGDHEWPLFAAISSALGKGGASWEQRNRHTPSQGRGMTTLLLESGSGGAASALTRESAGRHGL